MRSRSSARSSAHRRSQPLVLTRGPGTSRAAGSSRARGRSGRRASAKPSKRGADAAAFGIDSATTAMVAALSRPGLAPCAVPRDVPAHGRTSRGTRAGGGGARRAGRAQPSHPRPSGAGVRGGAGGGLGARGARRRRLRRRARWSGSRRRYARARAPARFTSRSAPSTTACPASATPAATTSSRPRRVGAALAAARVADDVGLTVSLIGTPAEESGGGKVLLSSAASSTACTRRSWCIPRRSTPPSRRCSPRRTSRCVHRQGGARVGVPRARHQRADALTVAQTAIGLLRQHLRPGDRVHGIVTAAARRRTSCRHARRPLHGARPDHRRPGRRAPQRRALLRGGRAGDGSAPGAAGDSPVYADVRHDPTLAALYQRNAEALGRRFTIPAAFLERAAGSTDMGNVSQVLPAIHPLIGIESLPAVNHQPEFAAALRHGGGRPGRDGRRDRAGVDGDRRGVGRGDRGAAASGALTRRRSSAEAQPGGVQTSRTVSTSGA